MNVTCPIVAQIGALQPCMGEILSRDVMLLTCRQKIIVKVNIMGEILSRDVKANIMGEIL